MAKERQEKAMLSTTEKDQREMLVENSNLQHQLKHVTEQLEKEKEKHLEDHKRLLRQNKDLKRKNRKGEIDETERQNSEIIALMEKYDALSQSYEESKKIIQDLEGKLKTEIVEKELIKQATEGFRAKCSELEDQLAESKREKEYQCDEKDRLNARLMAAKKETKELKDEKEKVYC